MQLVHQIKHKERLNSILFNNLGDKHSIARNSIMGIKFGLSKHIFIGFITYNLL